MNRYELVYDLKEHLDTYSQTYDDYMMSYGEADMIYHYIEEKDKEIEKLNRGYCPIKEKCNKGECDCTNEEYNQMCEENIKLNLEIERLNNIINEFDKWLLGEQMMFYKGNDGETLIRFNETISKWLELKGVDKDV